MITEKTQIAKLHQKCLNVFSSINKLKGYQCETLLVLLSEKQVSTEISGVQANTIENEEKGCRNNLGEERTLKLIISAVEKRTITRTEFMEFL